MSILSAGKGLKVTARAALVCPRSWVLFDAGAVPVVGAREYGLGRVVVCTPYAWEFDHLPRTELEDVQPQSERFYVSLFDWLRNGGQDKPGLKGAFRSAHDCIARREYQGAIEALETICAEHPDTPWQEQARYLMAQVLQQRLEDFEAAQEQYEAVFRKFPSGNTALAALMGRAACLEARGLSWEKVRDQYRQVASIAPDVEIGAAASRHATALTVRHEGTK